MAYLTDAEKRLLFSALAREKKICETIDADAAEDDTYVKLTPVIESLERKFHHDKFERDIYDKAVDRCIKILDTRHPQYHDVLNDRRDMVESLKDLKMHRPLSEDENNPIELSIQR